MSADAKKSSQILCEPWAPLALGLITLAAFAGRYNQGWLPLDDGYYLDQMVRVMDGDLPHRDFITNHPGAYFFLLWPFFLMFGVSLLSAKIPLILTGLGLVFVTFYLAKSCLSTPVAFALGLLMIPFGPLVFYTHSPSWPTLLLVLLAILLLLRNQNLFWVGLILGLAFCIKQSMGLYAMMAVLLTLCIPSESTTQESGKTAKFLLPAIAGGIFLVEIAQFIFWWQHTNAFGSTSELSSFTGPLINFMIFMAMPLFLTLFIFQKIYRSPQENLPSAKKMLVLFAGWITALIPLFAFYFVNGGMEALLALKNGIGATVATRQLSTFYHPIIQHFVTPFAPLYGVWFFGLWYLSFTVTAEKRQTIWLLTLLCAFLFWTAFPYPDPVYLVYPLVPFLMAWCLVLKEKMSWLPGQKTFGGLVIFFLLLIFVVQPSFLPSPNTVLLPGTRGQILVDSRTAELHIPLLEFLKNAGITPEQKILVIPDGGQVYFLSGHPNPGRDYTFPQPMTLADEQYYLDLLALPELRYLILSNAHFNYQSFSLPESITQAFHKNFRQIATPGAFIVLERVN